MNAKVTLSSIKVKGRPQEEKTLRNIFKVQGINRVEGSPEKENQAQLSLFSFFGHVRGMWKFPDQGWNLLHSSGLTHSSDNTGSLTSRATRSSHDIREVIYGLSHFDN